MLKCKKKKKIMWW